MLANILQSGIDRHGNMKNHSSATLIEIGNCFSNKASEKIVLPHWPRNITR